MFKVSSTGFKGGPSSSEHGFPITLEYSNPVLDFSERYCDSSNQIFAAVNGGLINKYLHMPINTQRHLPRQESISDTALLYDSLPMWCTLDPTLVEVLKRCTETPCIYMYIIVFHILFASFCILD